MATRVFLVRHGATVLIDHVAIQVTPSLGMLSPAHVGDHQQRALVYTAPTTSLSSTVLNVSSELNAKYGPAGINRVPSVSSAEFPV